eukprot:TRINITY_DN2737_c0_g1_i4.p1 TRINITY_DN2737_c0_g1~~TRINITY_DN2737_c0_g1_i4.p1  ORF type:complete len:364 (-),score=60.88 TRINITY_DN2737_c0_g1_i4:1410-2501(-)
MVFSESLLAIAWALLLSNYSVQVVARTVVLGAYVICAYGCFVFLFRLFYEYANSSPGKATLFTGIAALALGAFTQWLTNTATVAAQSLLDTLQHRLLTDDRVRAGLQTLLPFQLPTYDLYELLWIPVHDFLPIYIPRLLLGPSAIAAVVTLWHAVCYVALPFAYCAPPALLICCVTLCRGGHAELFMIGFGLMALLIGDMSGIVLFVTVCGCLLHLWRAQRRVSGLPFIWSRARTVVGLFSSFWIIPVAILTEGRIYDLEGLIFHVCVIAAVYYGLFWRLRVSLDKEVEVLWSAKGSWNFAITLAIAHIIFGALLAIPVHWVMILVHAVYCIPISMVQLRKQWFVTNGHLQAGTYNALDWALE